MLIASRLSPVRRLALGAVFACAPLGGAFAVEAAADENPSWIERRVDGLEQKLAFFGMGREERPAAPGAVQQAQSSMADIAVRLDRIENQMRQLNGRLDEMQFQIKRSDEAQKRFQSDAEFRFQDLEGKGGGGGGGAKPQKRGDAGPAAGGATVGDAGPAAGPSSLGAPRGGGSGGGGYSGGGSAGGGSGGGDSIGGLIDEGGPGDDPSGPMRITPPGVGQNQAALGGGPTGAVPRGGGNVSVGTGNARDQFDMGVGFMQRRDYEQAEQTFRDFIRSNPSDPLAADAQYWVGESLYQRKQYTDAADSFYKIYVEKPQSAKAPESMLKLGMSLNGMGKKEEACATIAEAGKKYTRIKSQSDRELKRISC